jgi:MFS family permease
MHDQREARRVPFAALRHRDFRLFWIGLVLSGFGTNFTQIAMTWQMYEMTGSPLQLGLLGLVRAVPSMVLLLFGGLLADAMDRRRLMVVTQAAQCAVSTTLLALAIAGALSPGVFYLASALFALFSSLENPARQAMVPNMVPAQDLTNALALNSSQRNVAMIAGPSLAGVTLAAFGAAANYGIDAFSWLFMVAALLSIKPVPQSRGGRRTMSFTALGEGFRYVWTHPLLLVMMLLDFAQNLFGNGRALLPVYAADILNVGPQGYGILSAANSVGSIATAAAMSAMPSIRRAGAGVLAGVLIAGASWALFAYSQVFWLSVALMFTQGMGNTISTVLRGTILQLNIPDALRGRVSSVNQVFTNGGPQLGQFRAGAMGQWLGPELSLLTGGLAVVGVVGLVSALVPMVRHFEIPDTEEETGTVTSDGASR